MTKALAWIRKSKGSDDDIGLETQREEVHRAAEEVADDVDVLDLGVQSGFSSMTRDGSGLLDQREDVQAAVDRIRAGAYDYIVAWDDRRISRDEYFSVIQYAATQGDAEFVYYADVQEDDLAFDIQRRVERQTKEEEIKKSKRALRERSEKGYDHGRPRFGMTYDEAGRYQVPGENYDTVEAIFEAREEGKSYEQISDELNVAVGTAKRVVDRREWYLERSQLAEKST